jgi:hypothetical protein
MPWKLDTPVNVGDLDTAPYQEIRITRFFNDSVRRLITVELEYGNTVDGTWVLGFPPRGKTTNVVIDGQAYLTLVGGAQPEAGESVYGAVKRTLYAYLREADAIGPGHLE